MGLLRELLSAVREGYLDAMQDHAPERGVARPVAQAEGSWFAPSMPVPAPTGEVRIRRANDEHGLK